MEKLPGGEAATDGISEFAYLDTTCTRLKQSTNMKNSTMLSGLINMTQAWDREKKSKSPTGVKHMTAGTSDGRYIYWATGTQVPTRNRTHDLLNTKQALYALSYKFSLLSG